MNEDLKITKEDLVLWLDRPPSNDDLDLCSYLSNAVENQYKYYEENKQLKEDLKEYDMIFDTFSKRKYAHRYLEERRKENPNLLAPDSDEIYEKYYQLKERIDKAIEYLEHNGYGYDCTGEIYYSLDEDEQQDLLEILKGETNE